VRVIVRFVVIERTRPGVSIDPEKFVDLAAADLKYKRKLEKEGKLIGGPCLDILADAYILETETLEEMGEIFFNSPTNFVMDREVHPLGTFEDSLEGMKEMRKK
jgi:muconolactone delta-isomerase